VIVVDASVVVAALVDGGLDGDAAREAMLGAEAHAPHLLDVEVLSAVRRLALAERLTAHGARGAVRALRELPVARHAHDPLLDRALELRDSITAYDACYVALAELLDATMMTADLRLARAPGMRCPVVTVSP
jgi:predicted nucleic acid-binding protein